MDDALLKQFITGELVHDVWNHITGDAVTIVYQQGDHKGRLVIGVDRAASKLPGQLYRARSPLYLVGGVQTAWAAEAQSSEEAVAAVWNRAKPTLLDTLNKRIPVTPILEPDGNFPNGPHRFVWSEEVDQ